MFWNRSGSSQNEAEFVISPRIWVDFEQILENFEQIQEDLEQVQEDFEQVQEDFVQVFLNLLKVFLNLLQVFLNLLQDFDLTFSFRAMGQDLGKISVRPGKPKRIVC